MWLPNGGGKETVMKKRKIALCAAMGAAGAYLYSICPRIKDRADMKPFTENRVYAHRGMHGGKIGENTLEAFSKAVENGYGIELDVRVSSDGQAVVAHDSALWHESGEGKSVSELTAEELKEYGIPLLSEVLKLVDGQVPLIVELKCETRDISICPIAAEVLDEYNGEYCIESFNPYVLKWYRECRPEIARGQLSTSFAREGMKGPKYFLLENLLVNSVSKPDFIAYNHKSPFNLSLMLCRKLYNTPVIAWTVETAEEWSKCADKFDAYICNGLPKKRIKKK